MGGVAPLAEKISEVVFEGFLWVTEKNQGVNCGLGHTEICTTGTNDSCEKDFLLHCFDQEDQSASRTGNFFISVHFFLNIFDKGEPHQCSCVLTDQVWLFNLKYTRTKNPLV